MIEVVVRTCTDSRARLLDFNDGAFGKYVIICIDLEESTISAVTLTNNLDYKKGPCRTKSHRSKDLKLLTATTT